jgi:hypothetical protein
MRPYPQRYCSRCLGSVAPRIPPQLSKRHLAATKVSLYWYMARVQVRGDRTFAVSSYASTASIRCDDMHSHKAKESSQTGMPAAYSRKCLPRRVVVPGLQKILAGPSPLQTI